MATASTAQNVAYRQDNLSSDLADAHADNLNALLQDPWGIALVPQKFFLVANSVSGRVTAQDAAGNSVNPGAFLVPSITGPGNGAVRAVVTDDTLAFAARDSSQFAFAVIAATAQGGLYLWGTDAQGDVPSAALLKADHSQTGAVYTSLAILAPTGAATMLAVADFHGGVVQLFDTGFAPLGSLNDPSLPPGFAPFGMQQVGNQLFVTFGVQDAEKQNPIAAAGNGIVSVFDLSGRFVRRFVTSGPLNAPWGVAQAGPDFGPFANAILIANAGDGIINAFDAATGEFLGPLQDGDGNPIQNSGLHGLRFGSRELGDPDTLYLTAGINQDKDGLFGAISTGLVSATEVDAAPAMLGQPARISIVVSAGPGNTGVPSGSASVNDGDVQLGSVRLANGVTTLDVTFTTAGSHILSVHYGGDATFLPSTSQADVAVSGAATSVTLDAPAAAAAGSAIVLTATLHSDAGVPTGQVDFRDGNTSLGTAPLDDSGVAVLRSNSLTPGTHSLTAIYEGDAKFSGSTSPQVAIQIAAADFSLAADRASATLAAGQSAQFVLTVTPSGGFNGGVTFSCSQSAGISCSFGPSTVNLSDHSATTTLTLSASANAANLGVPATGTGASLAVAYLIVAILFILAIRRMGLRITAMRTAYALLLFVITMMANSCGGAGANAVSSHRLASIQVMAQSGSVSHTTTLTITLE